MVEEWVGTDPLTARVDAQYVWHPEYVDALAVRYWDHDDNPGTALVPHYYLQDANYNVTAVTDNTGAVVERYAYTPYGEVTILNGASDADGADFSLDPNQVSDIGNVYLYTGRERDPETGIQHNRNRPYTPPLGRWLTRDPIGYEGSQWNLYEYVAGRPTIDRDPSGLSGGIAGWLCGYGPGGGGMNNIGRQLPPPIWGTCEEKLDKYTQICDDWRDKASDFADSQYTACKAECRTTYMNTPAFSPCMTSCALANQAYGQAIGKGHIACITAAQAEYTMCKTAELLEEIGDWLGEVW